MTTPGWWDKSAGQAAAGADAGAGASSSPERGCPSWCDSPHEADDHEATYHGRIVTRHDGATVALSHITYLDPDEPDSTVIIMDLGAADGPAELEETDAIRMLGTLKAAGDSPPWLAGALRSALDLLDPHAGWTAAGRGAASPHGR